MAVLAVVFLHYTLATGLILQPGGGYLGVAVFFVLSGYLITRIVWRDGSAPAPDAYRRFVRRRVQRLYPALTGLVVVGPPVLAAAGPETLMYDLRYAVLSFFQLTAFADVWGDPVFEVWGMTWSLTVEWTFYLTWPLVLVYLLKRGTSTLTACKVACLAGVVLYAAALPLSPRAFYVLPIGNLAVMLAGAALALLHRHRVERGTHLTGGRDPQMAALALLLFMVIVLIPGPGSAHVSYRLLFLPAAVIAALIVIDQREGTRGPARWLFETRFMRRMGVISYSVYLWHVPVLWTVWWAFEDLLPIVRVGIALAALVPVVALSFRFLELPWLRPSVRDKDKSATEAAEGKRVTRV